MKSENPKRLTVKIVRISINPNSKEKQRKTNHHCVRTKFTKPKIHFVNIEILSPRERAFLGEGGWVIIEKIIPVILFLKNI